MIGGRGAALILAAAIALPLPAAAQAPDPSLGTAPVAPAEPVAMREPEGGFSVAPFVSNMLDSKRDQVSVDAGAPGGGSYVEHVPQAFGLRLRAAL